MNLDRGSSMVISILGVRGQFRLSQEGQTRERERQTRESERQTREREKGQTREPRLYIKTFVVPSEQ